MIFVCRTLPRISYTGDEQIDLMLTWIRPSMSERNHMLQSITPGSKGK